jgi:hypothetical protein
MVHLIKAAGEASPIVNEYKQKYGSEAPGLLRLALTRSAPGTMKGHLCRWSMLSKWATAKKQVIYPMATETLVKYLLYRDRKGCGPSVPDAIRGTVQWIHNRLGMTPPDTTADLALAIRDRVVQDRGKEVKEAEPIPMGVVGRLEQFLGDQPVDNMSQPLPMFVWWVLCMIYASLRFDDACHVRPEELQPEPSALRGSSWQTKTERKRKSVPFVVADQSVQCQGWLHKGWAAFQQNLMSKRDFWMPHVSHKGGVFRMHLDQRMEYADSAKTFTAMLIAVGRLSPEQAEIFSWHSCKATILDTAAHQEENPLAIGLQGHWKDPTGAMPNKYTRKRMAIPLAMIGRVCKRIRAEEESVPAPAAERREPEPAEQVVQTPEPWEFIAAVTARATSKVHWFHTGAQISLCSRLCRARGVPMGKPMGDDACMQCKAKAQREA